MRIKSYRKLSKARKDGQFKESFNQEVFVSSLTIDLIRYRKKGEDEDGESESDASMKSLPCSRHESPRSTTHSRSSMSDSQSDDTPSLSESDNDTKKVFKIDIRHNLCNY
jgi:hypothetical protein